MEQRTATTTGLKAVAVAIYRGLSGQRSTYPVFSQDDFLRVPHRITTPSGEVRLLVSVEAVAQDDDAEVLGSGLGAEIVATVAACAPPRRGRAPRTTRRRTRSTTPRTMTWGSTASA